MDLNSIFLSYPDFVWQGVFSLASTLIAGLIIAFVTTFYLTIMVGLPPPQMMKET